MIFGLITQAFGVPGLIWALVIAATGAVALAKLTTKEEGSPR